MLLNINKQMTTLLAAYKKNKEVRAEIEELEKEIRVLERKIEESSSSAFIEKQARELFGLGREDDYWLILPDSKDIAKDFFKINVDEKLPNWRQWLELFW